VTATAFDERASRYEAALADALRAFVAGRLGHDVAVDGLRKLAGGTAHETWAFDVDRLDGTAPDRMVLRRDVERGMLDGDLGAEFDLLTGLDRLGISVPRTHWCVVDDSPLGQPFMIVDRVAGTDIRKHLAAHPEIDRRRLGRELVRLQVRLHRLDPQVELPRLAGDAGGAERELDTWTGLIDASGVAPGPMLGAASAWLRDHLPAGRRSGLVHGDFKTNNLLFGADATISVLDWELAHLGDPVEDVAWTMLWTTRFDLVGGLLSAEEYRAAYEHESGSSLDPGLLLFWRIFALVKLAAIFLTGVARGGAALPTLQLMGRGLHHIEAQLGELLLETLGRTADPAGPGEPRRTARATPSYDGSATLATVSTFLTDDVLPAVPNELTGEVRAAVKLLETAAREFDQRYRSVTAETRELLDRGTDIGNALGLADAVSACARLRRRAESSRAGLIELDEVCGAARALTSSLIVALQTAELDDGTTAARREAHRELLASTYACLVEHPRSRLSWQSVFPAASPRPAPTP
jgi:aminoglycoside phosphotransferase (APT) family kinase protein